MSRFGLGPRDWVRRPAAWVEPLRDPGLRAILLLLGGALLGFALCGLAWRGAARTTYVPFQLPWLLSAGLAGIAIIGTALGALTIHIGRRDAAAHRAVTAEIVRTAIELADDVRTGRTGRLR